MHRKSLLAFQIFNFPVALCLVIFPAVLINSPFIQINLSMYLK